MRRVMVRYRVRPDQAAANEELVRAVYDELDEVDPGGLRYATFVLDDGVTFVHLAQVDAQDGRNPVTELPAFRRFVESVRDRCEDPPVTSELREVGSYRLEAV
jgi:quinol monooxygenase YgiN